MSLIDVSFFIGEMNVPNTDQASTASLLQVYIDQYEPEYLTALLGPDLYAAFKDGLLLQPVPQEWTDLQNQLIVINGASKVSPITNYVYFFFTRRATYNNTGAGITQPAYENATVVDSKIETARAWNQMNKLSFTVYKFLITNCLVYGPLPYSLRFLNNDYLMYWFDWSYWWGFFPFNLRRCIPEIFRPINVTNI